MERADQEIIRRGWDEHYLVLQDVAVVVRHADGSFTLERQPLAASNVLGCAAAGFLAGLVLGATLTGATIGAMVGGLAPPPPPQLSSATPSSRRWRG